MEHRPAVHRGADRDAARESGAESDDGQDRPQRRPRHGTADAHGLVPPLHAKALPAQETRALLTARKLLLGKQHDVELGLRGILRGFGLKLGQVGKGRYEARIRELVAGHPMLEPIAEAMLQARSALKAEIATLHRRLLGIVREDAACQRLMTCPGVGPVVAATYKTAIDDPARFRKSKEIGPYLALTPRKYQSGETDSPKRAAFAAGTGHIKGRRRCGTDCAL